MKYVVVVWRSFLFYTIIAIAYRIMGKREMGELSIMDFIVSIFMAEIVAISIENYDKSIFLSLLPILFLVGIEILTSHFSMKNRKARNIIEGTPSMIISHGKVNFQEMKKQRFNLDDLLAQLRMNSIKSIEEIDYALLETSGKLSIFKKKEDPNGEYPLPLILDGEVNEKVLKEINRTNKWLEEELKKQEIKKEEIFYAFYRNKSLYFITNSQIK